MNGNAITRHILPVSLLLLDVDGVLTQGDIIYTDRADEIKTFSVKDGLGIRLMMDAGLQVGIVTGRSSGALKARCKNLGISMIFEGIGDKEKALGAILRDTGLDASEIAFAGDDLPDIRIMKKTGFPIAVANACPEVKQAALYTTSAYGGAGAVREICELILKTKGLWPKVIQRFL
jgi:3-deoxy-D-manno-octulosonate 8-phosphate phosphatase (KDO 8-P phosphatase)